MSRLSSFNTSLTIVAAAVLTACGGSNDSSPSTVAMSGVVTATALVPGSTTEPTLVAGVYSGAQVCADSNGNGRCDSGESPVRTDSSGKFTLTAAATTPLIADIGTDATNTATGAKVASRNVLRVALEQVDEQQATAITISALSTEIVRLTEANGSSYAAEKQNLATRLGVPLAAVTSDVNAAAAATKRAMLAESHALENRYTYAATKLDRGDLYPDALAVTGGDPRLTGMAGVTAATASVADTRKPITFVQAEQAAFNVEGVPRYDHIFIVMLENKGTNKILDSVYAPKINSYLKAGNQLTSYFATGNPSEPNYTALGGADDFGITDDSQWNCDATGANAPQDLPLPDKSQPGLASSPFAATCTQTAAVNHNIVGKPNLFNAMTSAGLTWRTYNESMNPGQDLRSDSVADSKVVAADHVYPIGAVGGNTAALGNAQLALPLPAGLYKTKHHPGMAYQNVRSAPEFKYSNRTMGGGQWDAALKNSSAYAIPSGYDFDQLGSDLQSGNVGNLNFVVPDQCDDMHGITVNGTAAGGAAGSASDCGGNAIITRGDNYVDYLVKKIQASPLWTNGQKKVAIVLMFDEGSATSGFNSCCGWNVSNSTVAAPLVKDGSGAWVRDASVNNYTKGNRGHGESVFGILTNQAGAPKGVSDSDAYSHFSFVRTLQDMFQLADPGVDGSYMNRSKYTEQFIAAHILDLPEYAGSADTHFDAVRPINHAFRIPPTYTAKQSSDVATPPQTGPDASQANVWAVR